MRYAVNIRYGQPGKIVFDYATYTVTIKEPDDVVLIEWEGASEWIRGHYGWLLLLLD